jgi:hypothetical protein
MKPHKHAEEIKAWADGHTIEFLTVDGNWEVAPHPSWLMTMEYRIKPEPKPDFTEERLVFWNMALSPDAILSDFAVHHWLDDSSNYAVLGKFKLTLDGDTGEVKLAEVVK